MNKQAMWSIAIKDMRAITSNIQIWLPMLIVPLILGVVLPSALLITARFFDLSMVGNTDMIVNVIQDLPEGGLRESLEVLPTLNHQLIYFFMLYGFTPFFMLIPAMASSVISANSFVGEKERKTLESLLFAPISMKTIFIGKILSAFIPAVAITFFTAILYGIVTNIIAYPLFDQMIFPTWEWVILIIWITPLLSLLVILFNIIISAKVKGYQEAYQLGSIIVLPIVALVVSQLTGLLFLSNFVLLFIGFIILILNIVFLQLATKWNDRFRLSEQQI
ncbi:ABC transporter permease subunit [Alkalihalobacterium chitinilyticum]|uniref:ABC transporter permease subunit n=1 Tax=Alkalihalobacterium chitinilyticum TaxID=2980103 RepID=A0ABT5VAY4_9BACI|nr:ABC transporter permease subunit [Alkalihalobacterium chitinilyticum]MDE5412611.1 ABC transporter permease subunit [Alkalihalobacterium chitinilyticum]